MQICGSHGQLLERENPHIMNKTLLRRFIRKMYDVCSDAANALSIVTMVEAQMTRVQACDEMDLIMACCAAQRRPGAGQRLIEMRNANGEVGVNTSDKEARVREFLLFLESGRLFLSRQFFSADDRPADVDDQRTKLIRQLGNYELKAIEGADPVYGKRRYTWTGKHRGPDDTMSSLLQLVFHMMRFYREPAYSAYWP